jgi:hypothetical protein
MFLTRGILCALLVAAAPAALAQGPAESGLPKARIKMKLMHLDQMLANNSAIDVSCKGKLQWTRQAGMADKDYLPANWQATIPAGGSISAFSQLPQSWKKDAQHAVIDAREEARIKKSEDPDRATRINSAPRFTSFSCDPASISRTEARALDPGRLLPAPVMNPGSVSASSDAKPAGISFSDPAAMRPRTVAGQSPARSGAVTSSSETPWW